MDNGKEGISIVVTHLILDDEIMHFSEENIKRISKYTKNPYELIIVDNGSPVKYSEVMKQKCDIYVRNRRNKGNGKAWDQGIEVATNDYIVLMDNDVWVEDGWDVEMIRKLKDPTVGITFPYSIVGNEYDKKESGFNIEYRGRRDGFCFAFHKSTYDAAGFFLCDQPFKLGYYEDDDFEARVQYDLGKKLITCPNSRVWHKGQGTSKKIWDKKFEAGIEANKVWYEKKWGGRYPYINA